MPYVSKGKYQYHFVSTTTIWYTMHISRDKHTAQLVVQCYRNKVLDHVLTQRIQTYLVWKTGYEGVLNDGDKVCFACYKSHLQILKHSQNHSIDTDLVELIQVIKSRHNYVNDVKNCR